MTKTAFKFKLVYFYLLASIFCLIPGMAISQTSPPEILLKNYRPRSIYNIPKTSIKKAKFSIIDMHTHPYANADEEITDWVKNMDEVGIEKSIVLTEATGALFDSTYSRYAKYPDRFDVWCGFDYTGYDKPGFGPAAVAELERCVQVGAKGVGELGDKGKGLFYSKPVKAWGMHLDDPRMDPLLEKCAELGLPINIHSGEPIWFYGPMDSTNDGLMSAYDWRLDNQKDLIDLDGMVDILIRTVQKHPKTTFIACHFANLNHDLKRLGKLLDTYQNLYVDISARFAESATVPKYAQSFFENYQDKLVYGTDLGYDTDMYRITFRILETRDEHFYEVDQLQYHWNLYGLGLDKTVLEKLYRTNALKILDTK